MCPSSSFTNGQRHNEVARDERQTPRNQSGEGSRRSDSPSNRNIVSRPPSHQNSNNKAIASIQPGAQPCDLPIDENADDTGLENQIKWIAEIIRTNAARRSTLQLPPARFEVEVGREGKPRSSVGSKGYRAKVFIMKNGGQLVFAASDLNQDYSKRIALMSLLRVMVDIYGRHTIALATIWQVLVRLGEEHVAEKA